MSTFDTKRLTWADNLKAFAIFLVVLGHTGLDGQSLLIHAIKTWIYEFHMPLFFMLSGLSFSFVYNRGFKSCAKQILNVCLIYVIQCTIYILFNIVTHYFINIQTQADVNLNNLCTFIVKPVAHFWYLHALIIVYLLDLLLKCVKKRMIKVIAIVIAVLTYVGWSTSGTISNALYYLLYFECGMYITKIDRGNNIVIMMSYIGVILSIVVPLLSINNRVLLFVLTVVIALSVSFFLVGLFKKRFDSNLKMITTMGGNCIWVYIFHTYFTASSRTVCNKIIPGIPEISMVIVTISGIVGPMIIMWIFNRLRIDKIVVKPIFYLWK